jgi:type VII secretion protein EccB
MATRRDQLQSYQFLLQRVVSALVYRKTDPAQSPFRRAGGAVFGGIMISVLALAITMVIGLFATNFGKNRDWMKGGAVVLDEDTGATYVVYPPDKLVGEEGLPPQRLYPALNFTSAALLAGTVDTFAVSTASLTGDDIPPRGMTIGIPDAPNSLPATDNLRTGGWSVCSQPAESGSGTGEPRSFLFVADHPDGGDKVASDEALYVKAEVSGDEYLVWNEHKFALNQNAIDGLQLDNPSPVADAYVDGTPEGQPLETPSVPDLGAESALSGYKVGKVLQIGEKYYVARSEDVGSITEVQAQMLLFNDDVKEKAYDGDTPSIDTEESLGGVKTEDLKPTPDDPASPPADKPEVTATGSDGTGTCVIYKSGLEAGEVRVGMTIKDDLGIDTQQVAGSSALADRVIVEGGAGVLVASGNADNGAGAQLLVTDNGHAYPLEGKETVTVLGYGKVTPTPVSPELVKLLPQGSGLSVEAARANAFDSTVSGGDDSASDEN